MTVVSPEEYRKAKTKIVSVPSGYNFKIRKMTPEVADALLKKLATKEELPPETLPELIELVLPACVIEPKIVASEGTSEALSVDELDPGDKIVLFMEVIDFSGLSAAAERARKSFRERITS